MTSTAGALAAHRALPLPATLLLAAALAVVDIVVVTVAAMLPAILMAAPALVPADQIDLGLWLIDTSGEAWLTVLPGAALLTAELYVFARLGRAQLDLVRRSAAPAPARTEPAPSAFVATLTPREREVLELMAEGLTNAAIAGRLFVSEATVRKHIGRIFAKLGAERGSTDRRVAAVVAYLRDDARV
ncbi:helix-turn-helix transcriptional regulator [Jiangella alba]|uniref:Regulatory protein, luxR family n=1 Tax=Jiangella alba TaxID=561176 RepID=A0A1H5PQE6_9ACTN|nr:helix-turn-helix transcriptional regulator [Jiangella alba]SEF15924.1 regulatory protein, luxR family [Jiangella alba]